MKVLITGASGFLGRRLLTLLPADWEIIAFGRTSPPAGAFRFIPGDLSSKDFTSRLPASIDAILHLAQSDSYSTFPGATSEVFQVNVGATAKLADYALSAGARSFVHMSTGSVYEPYTERLDETSLCAPSSLNGVSKYSAELALNLYRSHLDVCCLRLFFPFGPGQKNRLIPSLIERISTDQPVLLDGQNGLICTPTYIDDVCRISIQALESRWTGIVNLAGKDTLSVREIAEHIGKRLGKSPTFKTNAPHGMSITPATEKLSSIYPPHLITDFSTALDATISDFQHNDI